MPIYDVIIETTVTVKAETEKEAIKQVVENMSEFIDEHDMVVRFADNQSSIPYLK